MLDLSERLRRAGRREGEGEERERERKKVIVKTGNIRKRLTMVVVILVGLRT